MYGDGEGVLTAVAVMLPAEISPVEDTVGATVTLTFIEVEADTVIVTTCVTDIVPFVVQLGLTEGRALNDGDNVLDHSSDPDAEAPSCDNVVLGDFRSETERDALAHHVADGIL